MRNYMRAVAVAALVLGFCLQASAQWIYTPETGRWVNVKRLPKETAELQIEYARSLMLQGDYKKAIRETDKFSDYYADDPMADENQFLRGEIRLAQGKYMDAAKEFQQVVTVYPDTEMYDKVIAKQYEIGDLYFAKGESNLGDGWWKPFRKRPFRKSIDVYNMVIANQPFTDAAAEAQFKVGRSHLILDEYMDAALEFRRVIEDYSTSDWVDDASYALANTYIEASLPPDYDQTPSYLAVNAIDDFKERYPSDERNTELQPQRGEMRENIARQRLQTARFYEKRRKFESAKIYYEVVVDQFSETSSAEAAQNWLASYRSGGAAAVLEEAGEQTAVQ